MVGDQSRWNEENEVLPQIDGFRFVDPEDLTAETLELFPAKIVLSTLFARDHDVIEIAKRLSDLSFEGRYRVIADALPRPELILREVASVAPGLDFEILNLPRDS